MTAHQQVNKNNVWIVAAKVLALIGVLYVFFLSLELMGDSFKLMGKEVANNLLSGTQNPFIGLFTGVLVTSIIQSSSTVTSLTVGMVAGGLLGYHNAIPIIMGANIGTSITNIIVSIGHINNKVEFRRAFAASIVHDFFNTITVLWILPLQIYFNILEIPAKWASEAFAGVGGFKALSPVKALTKPVSHGILELFGHSGAVGSLIAVLLLFLSLRYLVKLLKLLVVGKVEAWFRRKLFKTAGRAFILGIVLTVIVQSSSITTSFIVPIVGAGILTLNQIFPFTLGANIGTTITAILAAMILNTEAAMTVAFAHLFFNIFGIVGIWFIRFIPIKLAEKFAAIVAERKYMAFVYLLVVFFLIPISLILISR